MIHPRLPLRVKNEHGQVYFSLKCPLKILPVFTKTIQRGTLSVSKFMVCSYTVLSLPLISQQKDQATTSLGSFFFYLESFSICRHHCFCPYSSASSLSKSTFDCTICPVSNQFFILSLINPIACQQEILHHKLYT